MQVLPPQHRRYKTIYSLMGFLFTKVSRKREDVFVGMKKISLKPGQCITCVREISEYTGLTEMQVRRALHRAQEFEELTRETTNHHSLITLNNFEITREC